MHSSDAASDAHKDEKAPAPALLAHRAVQVAQGRPDLHALLREEVDANWGRISVTGPCG